MEIRYDKIRAETAPHGVNVIVPRRVGKDILLALQGQTGPALVTELLKAMEPHFPTNEGTGQPMSVVMTLKGFAWQGGVSADASKDVFVTLRHPEIPGIHLIMPPEQAREIGKALIDLATSTETSDTAN